MAASIDRKRFSRMYGYGSNESRYMIRTNEFRIIHTKRITAKIEINVQDPPKAATLSASLWPNVVGSK